MKFILLKFPDETFFYKFKQDKFKKEKELKKELSWLDYFKILYDMQ